MRGFELFQLVHQTIEFGVADLGIVEHVVAILVMANLFAQGFDLRVEVLGRHRQELLYRRARQTSASATLIGRSSAAPWRQLGRYSELKAITTPVERGQVGHQPVFAGLVRNSENLAIPR